MPSPTITADQSYMTARDGRVTAYIGPDATHLFAAVVLRNAIGLWIKIRMVPTRGVTITSMLKRTTEYTHKPYTPRTAQVAVDDLTVWIDAMRAALPVVQS